MTIAKVEKYLEELDDDNNPRWQRIFFLIMANGGTRVRSWGMTTTGPGLHQRGLDQKDALALIEASAFLFGMFKALELDSDQITNLFLKYSEKYGAFFEENKKS